MCGILIFAVAGTTYAFFLISRSFANIEGTTECYNVNYTNGQDIARDIEIVDTYTLGKNTDIIMYSDSGCAQMNGTIYISTNDESTIDFSDKALKYTVVVNNSIVSEGYVDGTKNQKIYDGFILNTTSTTYKVYIWLDESLEDQTNSNDEYFSGFIHVQAIATSNYK